MQSQSEQGKRCVSPTCLNEADNGRYCNKCYKRKSREENPEKDAFNNLRNSARRRGVGFFLTFDEFVKFVVDTAYMRHKGRKAESLTIDRKDPKLGYRAGNLQILTLTQNIKKYHKGEVWQPEKQSKEQAGTPF